MQFYGLARPTSTSAEDLWVDTGREAVVEQRAFEPASDLPGPVGASKHYDAVWPP